MLLRIAAYDEYICASLPSLICLSALFSFPAMLTTIDEPYAPSDVILPTLVIALIGGVLFAVHNYFFHPLASFPGPTLAALTPWWRAYIELHGKENFTTRLWDLHARYGTYRLPLACRT